MKSKIAILNNPSSWLFNQKAERNQMNQQKSKSTFRSTLLALMLALILGGAGFLSSPAWAAEIKGFSSEAAKNAGPQYGGTITYHMHGGQGPPNSWDPVDNQGTTMLHVSPYLETLLSGDFEKYGPRGTNEYPFRMMSGHVPYHMYKGLLAESWTVPDQNTIIFKIRQGLMFQDKPGVMAGRELTAEDVAYSYNRNLSSGNMLSFYAPFTTITATDKYTVEIKLSSWVPDWTWKIGTYRFYPYPRELVEAGIGDWQNHIGIGTGPFMLEDFVEGSSVTYVKNPNYWDSYVYNDKKYEIPFVDRIVKTLIEEPAILIASLRTGKIDIMDSVGSQYVQTLKETSPEIELIEALEARGYLVGMRLDREPFDDARVRLAMNMAIDRQSVIDKVWDGKGSILNFPYHSNLPETLYTPLEKLPRSTQEQFEYNPERARQLLAEAGYSNGFETTIQLDNREALSDIAVLLVAFWKDIGVDVSIDVQDQTSMGSILRSKKHEPVTLFTHGGPADQFSPLSVYIFPKFVLNTSSSTTKSIVMDNPELQELYDRAFGTLDVVEQQKLLKELSQKILAGNYYAIVPTGHVNLAHWPWVENYYGEDGESVGGLQRRVFSRVWINSALKQELN